MCFMQQVTFRATIFRNFIIMPLKELLVPVSGEKKPQLHGGILSNFEVKIPKVKLNRDDLKSQCALRTY